MKTALGSLSETTLSEQENLKDAIDKQVESERGAFEQRYKENVFDNFCSSQPDHVPKELIECLRHGQIVEQDCSQLAKEYNWGEYERKGCEENWGLWLKTQHFDEKEIPIEAAIQDFDNEFAIPFKDQAENDKLVHNPYFYVLKGNDHLISNELSSAISCYDRAIKMDPTFSVNARYNKAQALLLYKENKGYKQDTALRELKEAKELINGINKSALMTFNTLITQTGCKIKTSQHVQHQLDVLSEQENYILQASDIIKNAQKKEYNVKLTSKILEEVFHESTEGHNKAISEATVNGLINLFTVEEVEPIPWGSIATIALIGIAQIVVGCMIVACTGGALGVGLITEGISDMIVSIEAAITGSFSWAAWAIQKVISLAVSIICAGFKGIKTACTAVKNTAKDLIGKTAVGAVKGGYQLAAKQVGVALGKGVMKKVLMEAGQYGTNKLFMEDLENEIKERVGKTITNALLNNPLIVNALKEDEKNGNSHWKQLFIKEGLALLQEQKEHACMVILRGIATGVAKNEYPLLDTCLKVAGVTKMLYELINYTDDFIAQFNDIVESHKTDIVSSTNSVSTKTVNDQTNHVQEETLTSAAPPPDVDLEEWDLKVHVIEEGTTYDSKIDTEQTQLRGNYINVGPSTPSSLADNFKSQIAKKLTGSIKNNVINPVLTYGAERCTGSLFAEFDRSVADHRNKVKTERDVRSKCNDLANTANVSKTTKGNEAEKGKKTPSNEKLNENAQEAIKRIENNEVKDATDLAVVSAITKTPIYIYENGKLKYVVGDGQPGNPACLEHIPPTSDNKSGHFEPLDKNIMVSRSGENNCALDAIYPQLNESEREKFKDGNSLKEATVNTIRSNPEMANDAYKLRDQLSEIAPDRLIYGGQKRQVIKEDSDSSTMDNATSDQFQNHHIIHKSLKDHPSIIKSGIDIVKDKKNVVSLPTDEQAQKDLGTKRSVHRGRHTNVSKEKINTKLNSIDEEGIQNKWKPEQYEAATNNVMREERTKLKLGETNLYEKRGNKATPRKRTKKQ